MPPTDNRIRCVLAHRLDMASGKAVVLAALDYAETQLDEFNRFTTGSPLYGFRDKMGFEPVVTAVIERAPPTDVVDAGEIGGFKLVASDRHQLVYGADSDGFCLSVITGRTYPPHVAYEMLKELYADFMTEVGKSAVKKVKRANSLTKRSKNVFAKACKKYDDLNKVSKVSNVQEKVESVVGQMQSNMKGQLKNIKTTEELKDKSAELEREAKIFKERAKKVKEQMQWKDIAMKLFYVIVAGIIVCVILLPILL